VQGLNLIPNAMQFFSICFSGATHGLMILDPKPQTLHPEP